jgi:hypothetical protein
MRLSWLANAVSLLYMECPIVRAANERVKRLHNQPSLSSRKLCSEEIIGLLKDHNLGDAYEREIYQASRFEIRSSHAVAS